MYNIVVKYNDFSYEENCYHVMKITTIVSDVTGGQTYNTLEDAKNVLNVIKNKIAAEEYLLDEIFLKSYINEKCLHIIDTCNLDVEIIIDKVIKKDSLTKEKYLVVNINDECRNIDVFDKFVVELYNQKYEILTVRFENTTIYAEFIIDPEDECIKNASSILEEKENTIITKENVPKEYMYVYDEIMKIVMEDIL